MVQIKRRREATTLDPKTKKEIDDDSKIKEEVKKSEFTNYVEILEVKSFLVIARNRIDSDKAIEKILSSQDEIIGVKSLPKGYLYAVHTMKLRDGF